MAKFKVLVEVEIRAHNKKKAGQAIEGWLSASKDFSANWNVGTVKTVGIEAK